MVTQVTSANFSTATVTAFTTPTVSSITVTDNTYTATGATAVALTGGYVKIVGTNFVSGCTVYIDSTPATSVTFVSSTQLNAQVPALASNTYVVYIINPDGSVAIRVNGINYSSTPTWVTSGSQTGIGGTVSIQLVATSDSTITYSIASGSTLPSGLSLTSGGLLSGTVTGSGTVVYNFSVVATDLETQKSTQAFTISISFNDTYWNYTTLLLNGETSVTPFISDASSNSLGLSIVGDTKPVLFSPYQGDGYYSASFNGSTDYLSVAANTAFAFGTGDFTVEAWIFYTGTLSGTLVPIAQSDAVGGSTNDKWFFAFNNATLIFNTHSSGGFNATISFSPSIGTWYHVVATRSSGTMRLFINGVSGTVSVTGTPSGYALSQNGLTIGAMSTPYYMTGYISNLRLVKGTALYTATFTALTSPLTAVANTQILTCQSNRFVDKSPNNFTLTVGGSPQISLVIPFTASSSYSTYGSAYFDGTGDGLTVPNNAGFKFGTGDFTVEFWLYDPGIKSGSDYIYLNAAAYGNWGLIKTAHVLYWQDYIAGNSVVSGPNISSLGLYNTWIHIAAVRNSSSSKIYVNGVVYGATADTRDYQGTGNLTIGLLTNYGATQAYIADLRIVKGTAVYTSAFTPTTSLLTAITNTQLLTCQYVGGANNYGIVDNSNFNNIITRAGNSTQGTFSPYSQTGFSNYFNGSSDYLSSTATAIGTNQFTVEAWVYLTSNTNYSGVFSMWPNSTSAIGIFIGFQNTGVLCGAIGNGNTADQIIGVSAVTTNTWHHIALTRNASNIVTTWLNGVSIGTVSSTKNADSTIVNIGKYYTNTSQYYLSGYISNLRVINGTALYTSSFTPSTTPLTPITNTSLLTCQSNRFIDNGSSNASLTINGTPQVQAYSPFGSISEATPISYSTLFGVGDYLQLPTSTAAFQFLTNNFTIECWVYLNSAVTAANRTIWYNYISSFTTDSIYFGGHASFNGQVVFYAYNLNSGAAPILTDPTVLTPYVWTHLAVVRNGNNFTLYRNGVSVSTATFSGSAVGNTWVYGGYIGTSGTSSINGCLSNFRIVNGSAVYSQNFTPPTSPLTNIANTSLLTCQSTTIKDNSNNALALTQNGSLKPYKYNPFGYTAQSITTYTPSIHGGSCYFDGSGDKLTIANYPSLALGANDFTLQAWFYTNAASTNQVVMTNGWSSYAPWLIQINTSNQLLLNMSTNGGSWVVNDQLLATVTTGQWYHVAVTRANGTLRAFVNGVQTYTASLATALYNGSQALNVGGRSDTAAVFNGYITDTQIINGTALYTSNFVPPTTPATITSQTTFLCNFTNGGIIDYHSSNVLETVGNAQLSTAIKKYGNSSISFSGSSQYLSMRQTPNTQYVSGDFTIEFWVYRNNTSDGALYSDRGTGDYNGIVIGFRLSYVFILVSTSGSSWSLDTYATNAGSTVSTGAWNHIAVARTGSTWNFFTNGTLNYTRTLSGTVVQTATSVNIGTDSLGTPPAFNGYIDDLRITKGYARYTGNFTAPTSTLQTF
jgi:hypothetical protein